LKILLINPRLLETESGRHQYSAGRKPIPYPVWLAYGAASLEKCGHEILLLDAQAHGLDSGIVEGQSKEFRPDLLVISSGPRRIQSDIQCATKLKQALGDVFIVFVGPHVSARSEELLASAPAVNAIARREFDLILCALAESLQDRTPLESVDGLTFRRNGSILSTPDAQLLQNLDEVPFVSKVYERFLDVRHYFNRNVKYPMVGIVTSRGCTYNCSFCVYSQTFLGRNIRCRSVANVIEELEYIAERLPAVKGIYFEDETMALNRQWCRELCQALIDRKLKFSWTANCRPDLDLDTLKIMKRAGCQTLCVGFETGNQDILNRIRKNLTLDRMQQFIARARKVGILIHGSFIAGLPGETISTLEKTLAFAQRLNPDSVEFLPLQIVAGASVHDSLAGRNETQRKKRIHEPSEAHALTPIAMELAPSDIADFCAHAPRKFYSSPTYLGKTLQQMLLRPKNIPRVARRLFALLSQ
jgi:radical SAM superfamily enzyme YgiQ (UPF0313 family)